MTDEPTETRESIRERYENSGNAPTEGYRNHGDLNPDAHGGIWATYDADHGEWEVYETIPTVEVGASVFSPPPREEDYGDQYVTTASVQWSDVVTEGGEWTEEAQREADAIHGGHDSPLGAVVDGQLTGFVAHFATHRTDPYPYRSPRHREDSYADVLESIGVEPEADDNSKYD